MLQRASAIEAITPQVSAGEGARVGVVTPNHADRVFLEDLLAGVGIETDCFDSVAELAPNLNERLDCVLLVAESLDEREMQSFQEAVHGQPAWSDIPILLLASEDNSLSALVEQVFARSGNITIIERPLHPVSLVSAIQVAVRSRGRQLQVRDLLEDRAAALRQRDEFLAMLAHELRNPLAPIRNAVHLMNTLDIADPLFISCRAMIDKQSRHITRLVDDLLDVSRLELGKIELRLQDLDINACVAAAAESCLPAATARRHSLTCRIAKEPLMVRADPVRLEQIFGNLLVNATKFTPEGGAITIGTRREGGDAIVWVSDTGIGIEPGMRSSVFDLFVQGNRSLARTEGGLGIGLTLVRRLVEMHGGSVQVTSGGRGLGSLFQARLPLLPADKPAKATEGKLAAKPESRKVLVVEDGDDIRETLGMLLTLWKHDVAFAKDGTEGLAVAREVHPDVALIDIGLPGLDGYQVARGIREIGSDWSKSVKLIALTGYGRDADREKAMQSGFDLHMLKPVDPADLQKAVASPVTRA